jgi:hypothetical protein
MVYDSQPFELWTGFQLARPYKYQTQKKSGFKMFPDLGSQQYRGDLNVVGN